VTRRTGYADLPLHGGRVPAWLTVRMAALGRVIVEAIVHHYGRDELLRRLAHPFWFQSFGAVMGMDWHSSGITTSVIGALKRGLTPIQSELGIYVCGGRGRQSRDTPNQLQEVGNRTGLDATGLTRTSRLVAKIDNTLVQDGFDLYLHAFIVSREGRWCVVQQGMNADWGEARRYHWLSESVASFLDSPHTAIEGRPQGTILNLAHADAWLNRAAALALVQGGPERIIRVLRQRTAHPHGTLDLFSPAVETPVHTGPPSSLPHLRMPAHHAVLDGDVDLRRLHGTLSAAADRGPADFPELLLTPGIGARTVAALAFVAEVVHGAPSRFRDPGRFSLAHGGKDGHPFPVPLKVYDETIRVLRSAVSRAALGKEDRLAALQRLDVQAREVDHITSGPYLQQYIDTELEHSRSYGGRAVGQHLVN
jgi:hypothetical protein